MLQRIYEITLQLIIKDFRVRYKGTILGYAWALVTPLLFASIFNFVFQHIIRFEINDYPLFLVSGLFAWQWFANSLHAGTLCFLQNSSLIKKLNFPRYLIPFSVVLIDALHFALALPIILAFLFIWGKPFYYHSWWYGMPLVAITQLAIIYGGMLCVASLNTIFRDIDKMISPLLTMLFYLTPVLYPLSAVPEDVVQFVWANPMTGVIAAWHGLFLHGTLEWAPLGYSIIWAVIMMLLGALVYNRLSSRFAEVL
jgi:lipopolysaccharide transport system permease protein